MSSDQRRAAGVLLLLWVTAGAPALRSQATSGDACPTDPQVPVEQNLCVEKLAEAGFLRVRLGAQVDGGVDVKGSVNSTGRVEAPQLKASQALVLGVTDEDVSSGDSCRVEGEMRYFRKGAQRGRLFLCATRRDGVSLIWRRIRLGG